MVLRLISGVLPPLEGEEDCGTCDRKLQKLEQAKSKAREFVARKGGLTFRTTFEKDKLFVCQQDKCLIMDAPPAVFREAKSLFSSLGFRFG